MSNGIYVSMCGAVARADQLDSIADNLANTQTPGFKASRPAFESFLANSANGAEDKVYPLAVATGYDLRPGPSSPTGNPLDVLPNDGAFLAVTLPNGSFAYTRDGRLTLDADRRLVSDGHPVVDRGGKPIVIPPDLNPSIDAKGKVWAGKNLEVADLALVHLGGPVDNVGPSLYVPAQGGQATPAEVGVRTGEVELGNSSALEGAIAMVSAQRSYDASMQAIQIYRQLDQRANEVGRAK